jgi:hypothetical protein
MLSASYEYVLERTVVRDMGGPSNYAAPSAPTERAAAAVRAWEGAWARRAAENARRDAQSRRDNRRGGRRLVGVSQAMQDRVGAIAAVAARELEIDSLPPIVFFEAEEGDSLLGYCDSAYNEIGIRADIDGEVLVEVVAHELGHYATPTAPHDVIFEYGELFARQYDGAPAPSLTAYPTSTSWSSPLMLSAPSRRWVFEC